MRQDSNKKILCFLKSPWSFFGLVFLISWLSWIPAAVLSQIEGASPPGLLLMIGGFGPSFVGVIMICLTKQWTGQIGFWKRVISFWRIGWKWYAFITMIFPVLSYISLLLENAFGSEMLTFSELEAFTKDPRLFLLLPVIVAQVALIGPIPEELGWRGYALEALQKRWNGLVSSLVVGFFWSLWHIPLFFIQDDTNFYYEWGFGSVLFWLFIIRMTLISVVITWVYNHNHRSILSAILLHFAYNFTFSFIYPIPDSMHLTGAILIALLAIAIVLQDRQSMLARSLSRVKSIFLR
jgi:membrane protease YdiL (CAAX protease family)